MKKKLVSFLTFILLIMICGILSFAVPFQKTELQDGKVGGSVRTELEMELIRERVISELMSPKAEPAHLAELLGTLREDGSWPDIDYADVSRTGWEHRFHLEHIGDLSRAWKQPESDYYQQPAVKEAIISALGFWVKHKFKCENWYFNVIRTPREIIRILLLMDGELPANLVEEALRLTLWADPSAVEHSIGGDVIKVGGINAKRALFLRDEVLLKESVKMMSETIHITTGQGIQPDMSFHHRSFAVNATTAYGMKTPQHFGRWAAHLNGTRFTFSEEKVKLVVDFYLDGATRSFVHGAKWDPGTFDRSISRNAVQLENSRPGLLSPDIPRNLMAATSYRKDELKENLSVRSGEKKLENEHSYFFWRSGYYSHQRPEYFASVRMYSTRSFNIDKPYNSEGLKNHHLGDGASFLSLTGEEYTDIWPVYDWQKIPGATVLQKPSLPSPEEITKAGLTDFAGGVNDDKYGTVAFDFISPHDPLAARKAWFFFDDEYVCLGAGIQSKGELPVATTINQCLLRGDVTVPEKEDRVNLMQGDHDLKTAFWVHHDKVAYLFPYPQDVRLSNKTESGNWRSINHQQWATDEEVHKDVFKLCIDHGNAPDRAKYAYIVVPGIEAEQVERYRNDCRIKILTNTPEVQAVEHTGLQIAQIAFYEPGGIKLNCGMTLKAETPGLVMVHLSGASVKKLTIADPTGKLDSFRLKLSSKMEGQGDHWSASWNESGEYSDIVVKLPSEEGYAGKSIVVAYDTANEITQDRQVNFPRKTEYVDKLPDPDSLYVFLMAGQSNMAGRGFVEPQDTIPDRRILTIDESMNWIYAKEPLNIYEPSMAGLDCGMSFARKLLDSVPEGIKVAVIPCAVGGSSIEQWLYNETHRGVKLLDNFEEKVNFAQKYGRIKGILWHQGESNANPDLIPKYAQRLDSVIVAFRGFVKNDSLPVILGELGSFAEPEDKQARWDSVNSIIHATAKKKNICVVGTGDLKDKGDKVHFNSESQRKMGERYAEKYLELAMPSRNLRQGRAEGMGQGVPIKQRDIKIGQ